MTDACVLQTIERMTVDGAKVVLIHDREIHEAWSCRWSFDEPDREGKWDYVGSGTMLATAVVRALDEGEIGRGIKPRPRKKSWRAEAKRHGATVATEGKDD